MITENAAFNALNDFRTIVNDHFTQAETKDAPFVWEIVCAKPSAYANSVITSMYVEVCISTKHLDRIISASVEIERDQDTERSLAPKALLRQINNRLRMAWKDWDAHSSAYEALDHTGFSHDRNGVAHDMAETLEMYHVLGNAIWSVLCATGNDGDEWLAKASRD